MTIPRWQIRRRCNDPKFVVIVTCQGCGTYYQYRHLLSALCGFAWQYKKKRRYGTCNFSLRQVLITDEFEGVEE